MAKLTSARGPLFASVRFRTGSFRQVLHQGGNHRTVQAGIASISDCGPSMAIIPHLARRVLPKPRLDDGRSAGVAWPTRCLPNRGQAKPDVG
jgi:hypothetical protein